MAAGDTYPPVIAQFLGDISDLAAKAEQAEAIVQGYQDTANAGGPAAVGEDLVPPEEEIEQSGLETGEQFGDAVAQGEAEALANTETEASGTAAAQQLAAGLVPGAHEAGAAAGTEAVAAMAETMASQSADAGAAAAVEAMEALERTAIPRATAAGSAVGRAYGIALTEDTLGAGYDDAQYDQMLMRMAAAAGAADMEADALSRLTPAALEAAQGYSAIGQAALDADDEASSAMGDVRAYLQDVGATAAMTGEKIEALGGSTMDLPSIFASSELSAMGVASAVFGLGTAVVGAGLLIADFGGTAAGDLTQVKDAFRDTAQQASADFGPAMESITQDMVGLAQKVEPQVQEIFDGLEGPAEAFFQGLSSSAQEGMEGLVPAIAQLDPLIATIGSDLGPVVEGVDGFLQQMAAAFEGNGGQQALAEFAGALEQLLPVLGQVAGEMGEGLLRDATMLAPVIETVADAFAAIGPTGDMVIIDFLAIGKVISGITGPINTVIGTLEGLGQFMDLLGLDVTRLWTTQATEAATSAATVEEASGVIVEAEAQAAGAMEAEGAAAETAAAEVVAAAETAGAVWEQTALEIEGASAAGGVAMEAEASAAETSAAEVVAAAETQAVAWEQMALDIEVSSVAAAGAMEAEGAAALEMGAELGAVSMPMSIFIAAAAALTYGLFELGTHYQDVTNFFSGIGSSISSGLASSDAQIGIWASRALSDLEGPFQGADDVLYGAGEDIVSGLGQGLTDAENDILGPLDSLGSSINNWFKSILGIASPSTVTRAYGQDYGLGFALGVGDSADLVHAASSSLASSAAGGFSSGGGGGGSGSYGAGIGSGGTTTINLTVNVTQTSGTPTETGDAVVTALQQVNISNGTSMASHTGLKG
jgi:hypothetical protein